MYSIFNFKVRGQEAGKVTVSGESSHRVTLSKVKKGTRLFLETAEDGTPPVAIRSAENDKDVDWDSGIVDLAQISQIANRQIVNSIKLGKFAETIASIRATALSRQIGERATYLMLQANTDDAKITIGSHMPGSILLMEAGETALLVRKGGFMVGQEGIVIGRFTLTGENSKLYSQMLGNGFLQSISGSGFYCIEIFGNCPEPTELFPGETLIVDPKRLIAMTESVHIISPWKVSEQQNVRDAEGADYFLTLKADIRGGYVYVSDLPQTPKHKKKN